MFNVDLFVQSLRDLGLSYSDYLEKQSTSPVRQLLWSDDLRKIFKGYLTEIAIWEVFRLTGDQTPFIIEAPFNHPPGATEEKRMELLKRNSELLFNSPLFSFVLSTSIRFDVRDVRIEFSYGTPDLSTFFMFSEITSDSIIAEYLRLRESSNGNLEEPTVQELLGEPGFHWSDFNDHGEYIGPDKSLIEATATVLSSPETTNFSPISALTAIYFFFKNTIQDGEEFDWKKYRVVLKIVLEGSDISPEANDVIDLIKAASKIEAYEKNIQKVSIRADATFTGNGEFTSMNNISISDMLAFSFDISAIKKRNSIKESPLSPEDHRRLMAEANAMDDRATHLLPPYSKLC